MAGGRHWGVAIPTLAALVAGGSVSFADTSMEPASVTRSSPIWKWTLPAGETLPQTIIVQGVKAGGAFRPQSAYLPESEARPAAGPPLVRPILPLATDILPQASARLFGAEERFDAEGSHRVTIACRAGDRPAGLVLSFDKAFPARAALSIDVDGDLEAARLVLVRPGGDAGREEDIIAEAAPATGRIELADGVGAADAVLVLVCPNEARSLSIEAIRLEPGNAAGETGIGGWIWTPSDWQGRTDDLLKRLQAAGLTELFLQLPLQEEAALDDLVPMLRTLKMAGVRLVAVEGDPAMVTPEGQRHALERAQRLVRFRADHPAVIEEVQYDVEPYLLQSHAADPARSWTAWADLVAQLHATTGEPISAVVPFWMIGDEAAQAALAAAGPHIREFVVMAYRTDASAVEAMAAPWLERMAGSAAVRIALESGPLPVEFHRTYRRAERGELMLSLADDKMRVELFDSVDETSVTSAAYAFSHEVEADPSRVTFAGDRRRLEETGRVLLRNLGAWPNFRGLAYHAFLEVSEKQSQGAGRREEMMTGPTILVCDDDPLLIELMDFRLRAKGYHVEIARDGAEALEKAATVEPAAIILDAMMPQIDGFEVLSRLKTDTGLADIPVIMLTARKAESDIVSALDKGADDYLVKPFIPDELMARISRLLARRRRG
jgi:CheY-like chemotaxis protein